MPDANWLNDSSPASKAKEACDLDKYNSSLAILVQNARMSTAQAWLLKS